MESTVVLVSKRNKGTTATKAGGTDARLCIYYICRKDLICGLVKQAIIFASSLKRFSFILHNVH